MKKFLIVLGFVLVYFLSTVAFASGYYITGDGVRVRSAPVNKKDNIIGKLYYGDEINVIGEKGGWYKIKYGDGFGYVTASFIAEKGDEISSKTVALVKKETVLRKTSSSKAEKLATVPINTVLFVEKQEGKWVKVNFDGQVGYVSKKALDIKSFKKMTCIGAYTITFHQNDEGRTNNIKKAVKKINKTVIKPGQKFSFLKVIGGSRKNYEEATECYEDDVFWGGGLIHVATTLHKAVNMAQHNGYNIKVKEKHRYELLTPYAKKGEEAFIGIDEKDDFSFVNKGDSTLKIYSLYKGDSVIILIFKK